MYRAVPCDYQDIRKCGREFPRNFAVDSYCAKTIPELLEHIDNWGSRWVMYPDVAIMRADDSKITGRFVRVLRGRTA